MKILLATDGSTFRERVVNVVASRSWPAGSVIKIVYVVHPPIPDIPDPLLMLYGARMQMLEHERKEGKATVEQAASRLRAGVGSHSLEITTEVMEGSPKELIVEEAERWGADVIVLGSRGRGAAKRFLPGSVSLAVATHAPCSSVEVKLPRLSNFLARIENQSSIWFIHEASILITFFTWRKRPVL